MCAILGLPIFEATREREGRAIVAMTKQSNVGLSEISVLIVFG